VLPPERPSVLLGCFAGVIAACILQGTAPGGLAWMMVLLVTLYSYCALTVPSRQRPSGVGCARWPRSAPCASSSSPSSPAATWCAPCLHGRAGVKRA
jgi:hypothetical protein